MKRKHQLPAIVLPPPSLPEPYQGLGPLAVLPPRLLPILPMPPCVIEPSATVTTTAATITATKTTTAPASATRPSVRRRARKQQAPSVGTPPTGVFYPPALCIKAAEADEAIQKSTIKRRKLRAKHKDGPVHTKCMARAIKREKQLKEEKPEEKSTIKARVTEEKRVQAECEKKEDLVQYTRSTEQMQITELHYTEMHHTVPAPNLDKIRSDLRETTIMQMMYVSGETGEPSLETLAIIEEIVRAQVIELVNSPP